MTISLEQLADGSITDRNFQRLVSLVPDTGGQSVGIRFGSDAGVVFTASASSAAKSVTHGLGRTPICAFVISSTQGMIMSADALGATTFNARGSFNAVITGTFPFTWMVIG